MVISLRCPTLAVPSKTKRPNETPAPVVLCKAELGHVSEAVSVRISICNIFFDVNFLSLPHSDYIKMINKFNLLEKSPSQLPNLLIQSRPSKCSIQIFRCVFSLISKKARTGWRWPTCDTKNLRMIVEVWFPSKKSGQKYVDLLVCTLTPSSQVLSRGVRLDIRKAGFCGPGIQFVRCFGALVSFLLPQRKMPMAYKVTTAKNLLVAMKNLSIGPRNQKWTLQQSTFLPNPGHQK